MKTDQSGGAVIEHGTFGLSSLPVILKNVKLYRKNRKGQATCFRMQYDHTCFHRYQALLNIAKVVPRAIFHALGRDYL